MLVIMLCWLQKVIYLNPELSWWKWICQRRESPLNMADESVNEWTSRLFSSRLSCRNDWWLHQVTEMHNNMLVRWKWVTARKKGGVKMQRLRVITWKRLKVEVIHGKLTVIWIFFVWADLVIRVQFFWASPLGHHSRAAKPSVPFGGWYRGQKASMWSTVCSAYAVRLGYHKAPFVHCWEKQSNAST